MSIITKQIAYDVALLLCVKKEKEVKKSSNILKDFFTDFYEKQLPKSVLEGFKINPDYYKKADYISVVGTGLNWNSIDFNKKLPIKENNVAIDEKTAAKLVVMMNKKSEDLKGYNALMTEIQNALLNLRTYKKIEENFPEAFKLLPEKISTKLSINLSEIRSKI